MTQWNKVLPQNVYTFRGFHPRNRKHTRHFICNVFLYVKHLRSIKQQGYIKNELPITKIISVHHHHHHHHYSNNKSHLLFLRMFRNFSQKTKTKY